MKKGIIFEIENRTATIMTSNGDFKRVKLNHDHYQVGDEYEPTPRELKFIKPNVIQGFALLAMLFVILYIPSINYFNTLDIYGYINIDINPSVELAYNDAFKVVKITALNDDGELIIDSLDNVIDRPLNDVINEVVLESYDLIGPAEEKATMVTITDIKGTMNVEQEKNYLSEKLKNYRVMVLESSEAIYTKAKENMVSPGKHIILEQLGESTTKDITVNELFDKLEEEAKVDENAEEATEDTSDDQVDENSDGVEEATDDESVTEEPETEDVTDSESSSESIDQSESTTETPNQPQPTYDEPEDEIEVEDDDLSDDLEDDDSDDYEDDENDDEAEEDEDEEDELDEEDEFEDEDLDLEDEIESFRQEIEDELNELNEEIEDELDSFDDDFDEEDEEDDEDDDDFEEDLESFEEEMNEEIDEELDSLE